MVKYSDYNEWRAQEADNLDIQLDRPRVNAPIHKARPRVRRWLGREDRRYPNTAYFDATSLADTYRHAISTTNREVGGMLIGDIFEDNGIYVIVRASIVARGAIERSASFTITHESWAEILRELDSLHPGSKIVGWYHTHPGYGLFLSSADLHIHQSFFTYSFQVALVIEAIRHDLGLFQWLNGSMQRVPGIPLIGERHDVAEALREFHHRPRKYPMKPERSPGNSLRPENTSQIQDSIDVEIDLSDNMPKSNPASDSEDDKGLLVDKKI